MKPQFKKTGIALALSMVTATAFASIVRSDVDYQTFRDFGENKGVYAVGEKNIPVYDLKGNYLGNALPKDVPMIDFSSVDTNRYISTLLANQYMTSVDHNSDLHFQGTKFGLKGTTNGIRPYEYVVADRNVMPEHDYIVPRLTKMVTEVAPIKFSSLDPKDPTYLTTNRFSAFVRVGSGQQGVRDDNKNAVTVKFNPYEFATGGTALNLNRFLETLTGTVNGHRLDDPTISTGPLVSYATKGDSGSGLFGYDTVLGEWVYIGSVAQYAGLGNIYNNYILSQPDFIKETMASDVGLMLHNTEKNKNYVWADKGNGVSDLGGNSVQIAKGSDLNNGKDIVVSGENATINLASNINQGAGGLYFANNATVKALNNQNTWLGSGVVVAENKNVEWQVKNPERDRLSKLGKGTLTVRGEGINKGKISVGDGTVILDQKANHEGKQAFSAVEISSGRGTVVLNSADQVATNAISFGYRGGKLDVNGNNLTFTKINHADNGAEVTNNNAKKATINLTGSSSNSNVDSFAGKFTGNLDINYSNKAHKSYVLTGGSDVKGALSAKDTKLILTGAPVEYAYDYDNGKNIVKDTEWVNRNYNAAVINVNNSTLDVSRNVAKLTSAINAVNGVVTLGYENGVSQICINNAKDNKTLCEIKKVSDDVLKSMPVTQATGNMTLKGSQATLSNVDLTGTIQTDTKSAVTLQSGSSWTMTGDSTVGNLDTKGTITLGKSGHKFNILTVQGNLSGGGLFKFSTDLASLSSNRLVVNGQVTGKHTISIQDSGREPVVSELAKAGSSKVNLVTLHSKQNGSYTFELEKGYVDAGAYRYKLDKNFEISSPVLDQSIKTVIEERASEERAKLEAEQRLAQEKAKKAEEQRLAQEKAKKAEEQRLAQEKAKQAEEQRLAQEKAKKAEEQRLAQEKAKQAEEQRLVQEKAKKAEEQRLAQEKAKKAEEQRLAQEKAKKAEEQRLAQEKAKQVEEQRLAQEKAKQVEEQRLAQEKAKQVEEQRLAQEKKDAEFKAQQEKAEQERLTAEAEAKAKAEQEKAKLAEKQRLEQEKKDAEKLEKEGLAKEDSNKTSDNKTADTSINGVKANNTVSVETQGKTQAESMSKYANSAVTSSVVSTQMITLANNRLTKDIALNNDNVWVNVDAGQLDGGSQEYRNYTLRSSYKEIGAQTLLNDNLKVGVLLAENRAKGYADNVSLNSRVLQTSVFAKYKWNNGLFAAIDAGLGRVKNTLSLDGENVATAQTFGRVGLTTGAELKAGNFSLEPFVSVAHYSLGATDYTLNGAKVVTDKQSMMVYQFGAKATYDFEFVDFNVKPFVGGYYSTGSKEHSVKVNNHDFTHSFDKMTTAFAGVEVKTGNLSVSLSGTTTKGNNIKRDNSLMFNVGYQW